MNLIVSTPEGRVFEGEVEKLEAPAHDGSVGILKDHAPFLTELGGGMLVAWDTDGQEKKMVLSGGYLQVLDNRVTILATRVFEPGEIDFDLIEQDLKAASAIVPRSPNEFDKKEKALARAHKLLNFRS